MNEFFLTLWRASLFGVAALAIALLLQWILSSRVPARWRVWVWRVALIQTALALIPFAPIALKVLPAKAPIAAPQAVEAPVSKAPIIADRPAVAASPDTGMAPAALMPPAIIEAPATQTAPIAKPHYLIDINSWDDVAVCIYLLGVALQIALLLRNVVRVRRALNACAPLDNAPLRPIATRLKIRRLPRLLCSASGSPFLVGIARPTIVVPQTLNESHLEAVFAHELAHHKRRDLTWNAFLWALQTALWFHPLSWFSRRYHALEVESACDELTLQLTRIAPKSYGALLIGAESSQPSPLTAGVNDHFFALQTRLARLGRAPMQPRRRTAWLLSSALLVSFVAVVPVELTARAQTEPPRATGSQSLRGTVRDVNGKPVGKAKVYIMQPMDDGGDPMAQTQTDANGKFALDKLKIDQYGVVVFVDGARRGIAEKQFDLNTADDANNFAIQLPQQSEAMLILRDSKHHPVRKVEMRLGRVGNSFNSWLAMPRAVKARYRATSDASGSVKFPPLPLGMLAQFQLADQFSKPTIYGSGDLRGGQYAPLAAENAVRLKGTGILRNITLVPPIRLEGQISLPDGKPQGNVLILARRINAAEAAGNDDAREQLIAQTRSNAQGRYVMDGLRPGRYYVWTYPEKQLTRSYSSEVFKRNLKEKTNRVDFKLSRGAIIQGVVVSKSSGKPVKGQTMYLFDSQENNQYTITDARGYFKFRALGGKQRLRVHKNGQNSPPPGFSLPEESEFNFTIKNGQKRDFKIALPGKAIEQNTRPIRGVVLGPDGKPAADATVFYRSMSDASRELQPVASDKNGRFSVAQPYLRAAPIQLWADAGDLTTAQSLVATPGQDVALRLARDAWVHIDGQVVDENKRPLAGASIDQFVLIGNNGTNTRTAKSDANGRFRFERVRPGVGSLIYAKKPGYDLGSDEQDSVKGGQILRPLITLRRAPKTLSGIVYDEAGKPAKNYQVSASGQSASVATRADGKFYSSQVFAGPITISIFTRTGNQSWRGFKAMGGDKNIIIRLSRDNRMSNGGLQLAPNKISPDSLIGKIAPAIRATKWSNGRAMPLEKLRGQVVLLTFNFFGRGIDTEIRDVARSQQTRFQAIGIDLSIEGMRTPPRVLTTDEIAGQIGFPIAVDAALPDRKLIGWQTFESYGQSKYAVIGRDGRVVYAGEKLDRAIELATAAG